MKFIEGGVTAAQGFTAAGIFCGIRKNKTKPDLAMIYAKTPCAAAAVYTQNLVKGAPLRVTQKNLSDGKAQAVLCNSGNANTCNADGEEKAWKMCEIAAKALNIRPQDVIVASTGVIGQVLPIEPIENAAPALAKALSRDGSESAARAIMTTDTKVKNLSVEVFVGGKPVRIGGIAKGSGMIHPNMATMLCFLTTDASILPEVLNKALHEAVNVSFNMVSVDGDTSTNDMVSIMASGLAGNETIPADSQEYNAFTEALTALCTVLAREVAGDGEGATKLLISHVTGAKSPEDARLAAKGVICSSLFKAAMFGADANWGRVLCAIGYSGAQTDIQAVDVSFASDAGKIEVCRNGAGVDFDEGLAKKILTCSEINTEITLHDGDSEATAFGCDLTYDYVKINGDYRT
ncbi:bifunctional glutamate N-acetyltransferase/amino-acid acetyltransferase ArgJ [Caproiciproducens galactitolivorans]|uniref:Arginine biosynthesis bifunctional protein ArgJ n=1 Tax=Caproiciproducens galactitolivorans TaxID=642589 RepID=A0ABT4BW33_9FIRM|nr:bifunctional glutamate N-acetyltransferase/amino-acid acetyltransferase ArgJ [Caproiciproducens galactitolivorans]MCY1715104.1 bifunctional glutamate N-acetyltransferase/amino-acid acetyltransferase ArgJ [Caproiciproducens galactitolivorans]